MIPADVSALAPRPDSANGKGGGAGDGKATAGLGALFGAALDGVAGRDRGPVSGRDGEGGQRRAPAPDGALSEGDGEAATAARGEGALRSLAFGFDRTLPIRPGALALSALRDEAVPAPDGEAVEGDGDADAALAQAEGAAGLLAALTGAAAAKPAAPPRPQAASSPRADGPAAASGTADPQAAPEPRAPASRAAALFPESAELSLATRAEPTPGMALKATVVSQATHLPPALGTANLSAIVDGAARLLSDGDGSGRATLAFPPELSGRDAHAALSARPVKVLTVQLQPVSLGTVTIALRLTADGVAMEITAADAKAAAMLRQDEQRIVDAVRRSGLVGEVVAIHTADPARGGSTNGQAGSDASGNGQQAAGGEARRDGPAGQGGDGRNPSRGDGFGLERRFDDGAVLESGLRGARPDDGVYL